jgi:alpha,alpha-trehalase
MFHKTKKLATNVSTSLSSGLASNVSVMLSGHQRISIEDVSHARQYIKDYWQKLERYHPKDDDNLIGLAHTYLVPAYEKDHEFDFNELYYWDSYFMIQGILDEEHKELVLGILEDFIQLYKRFKIVPNASRTYLTGRSQPPFMTSFIFDVYEAYGMSNDWLTEKMTVAEAEYNNVWMGTTKPNVRQVYHGLSRYYDINYIHDLAEAESGWDMTTRFNRKCLNYLPVDLNSLLYKYETDFARYYTIINNKKVAEQWQSSARHRKHEMKMLMWSNLRGMYYDYNFVKERRGTNGSLAAFYPMWAGMVDKETAKILVKSLKRFEQKGGLATTESQQLNKLTPGNIPTQWAYPNGWAPLHYIVIKGLERYGYDEDAKRIGLKWIKTNLDWFDAKGVFLEKYNVVSPLKPPAKGLYPSQTGFGWTNAVFEKLCQDLIDGKKATNN